MQIDWLPIILGTHCWMPMAIISSSQTKMMFGCHRNLTKVWPFSENTGGGIGAAFYVGDENLHHIGEVIYNHHAPFFSLKDQIGIYGFSMGFCKEELKYILPLPSFVAGHDKYIQYSLKWRNKLHFIDEPCAIHRWTGTHNVSSFTHNNSQPPFFVKCLFRLNTYLSVIWRSIVR